MVIVDSIVLPDKDSCVLFQFISKVICRTYYQQVIP